MNTDIEVFDNFLEHELFKKISDKIINSQWSYSDLIISLDKRICDELDNHQMYNMIYSDDEPKSDMFHLIRAMMMNDKFNFKSLIKIKANLSFRTTEKIIHGYHVDVPYECKTAIYYLNTNDGCTMFKDGREIGSVENRLVIFNSQLEHTGTTCTDQKIRSVINFNYF